jgi:membrane protease YdiL (CAAX protease family)
LRAIVLIVAGTPLWVWALLALLLFLGIRAMWPTTAPLWRLAILPTVFFVWGFYGLFTLHSFTVQRLLPWAVALAAGIGVGLMIAGLAKIRADKTRHAVQMPGSSLTLVLSLLILQRSMCSASSTRDGLTCSLRCGSGCPRLPCLAC